MIKKQFLKKKQTNMYKRNKYENQEEKWTRQLNEIAGAQRYMCDTKRENIAERKSDKRVR